MQNCQNHLCIKCYYNYYSNGAFAPDYGQEIRNPSKRFLVWDCIIPTDFSVCIGAVNQPPGNPLTSFQRL